MSRIWSLYTYIQIHMQMHCVDRYTKHSEICLPFRDYACIKIIFSFTNSVKIKFAQSYSVDFNTFIVEMFYTFREPNFFTFRVNCSQIVSIFTFSVDILFTFSYLFTYRGICTFDGATLVHFR